MNQFFRMALGNRYSVLLTTLAAYLLVVVVEGVITGREARVIDLENPFLDFNFAYHTDFGSGSSDDDLEDG